MKSGARLALPTQRKDVLDLMTKYLADCSDLRRTIIATKKLESSLLLSKP